MQTFSKIDHLTYKAFRLCKQPKIHRLNYLTRSSHAYCNIILARVNKKIVWYVICVIILSANDTKKGILFNTF